MDPFLTYADNRSLREMVWRNYYNRGDNGSENDNKAIINPVVNTSSFASTSDVHDVTGASGRLRALLVPNNVCPDTTR
ncbi:MAG: hypothetical protein ABGX16_20095 [Pirellulales bacterium]